MTDTTDATHDPIVIEKSVHGGSGLGRLPGGKVVMVAGALPGETVRYDIIKEESRHILARATEILEAAPERVEPVCPFYADCGGCDLQHADYPAQLAMKTAVVRDNLERAGIGTTDELFAPPLPSPLTLGYRYRLRLHTSKAGIGFYQRRTNTVTPVSRCLLATRGINATMEKIAAHEPLRRFLARHAKEVEIAQCPQSGRIALVLQANKSYEEKHITQATALFGETRAADSVVVGQGLGIYQCGRSGAVLRQSFHYERLGVAEYALSWPAGVFFQANCRQNKQLVALALEAAGAARPESALDLFCGTGNFSVPLALSGVRVVGVENNRSSAIWAQNNAETAGLEPEECRMICADAPRETMRLAASGARFDAVILDPPRQGLGRSAKLLPELGPKTIVSISCDPATHARDLRLMLAGGYRLARVLVVDMFPQTHHIEAVAVLER